MSEEYYLPADGESLSWSETWIKALTRPSVATYEEIVNDPNAGPRRAITWMIACSLLGVIFYIIFGYMFGIDAIMRMDEALESMLLVFLCFVPFMIFVSILEVVINSGISQLIAKLLGGTGTFSKLIYAFAAYQAPLTLIRFINGIPLIKILYMPLLLYGIFLSIIALKAVHKFGWGRAILSSVPIWIVFGLLIIVTLMVS